ncbi:hypothetical protein MW887_002449 [Aspergillus wentii]|nr:hypothetical protein MW887_002449 [Aspergillus wentii]
MSGTCISLSGSTQCPAFNGSSISTNSSLYADFPFLENVANLTQFDQELSNYINGSYIESKYVDYLGCQSINSTDIDNYYARYTTSALMATSEEEIVVNSDLCEEKRSDYMSQIRSDFTVCALPADSLTGSCISGADNEPDECGFKSNIMGLCGYCRSSSPNSTDTCCESANAATKCKNISIPSSTLSPVIPSSTAGSGGSSHSLSGGQIAGIVIGSVAAFALLAALAAFLLLCMRRKRNTRDDTALNQPNPQRKGSPSMHSGTSQKGFTFVPGGRVARMSALREVPSSSPARSRRSAFFGGAKYSDSSDSEYVGASPGAMSKKIPPVTGKRTGSLSSNSVLAGSGNDTSPRSGTVGQYSSPGMTSGQSEQMSAFNDYYSQDDIHPGDRVSALWAYQPRAGDEFSLERGDMLKVIGIWDDGWATGVRIPDNAEDYDIRYREQRDSGVSNGSHKMPSPAPSGEIKAFPLVCVCLPQHWRKIIDGGQDGLG